MFRCVVCLVVISLCNGNYTTETDYYEIERKLIDSLKSHYDPTIRPWIGTNKWQETKFEVGVATYLHALLEIDEKGETMTTSVAIAMKWLDPKMSWDPELYGNITYIYMQTKDVWRPKWFITNAVDKDSVIKFEDWVPVMYDSEGEAMWQQMGTIKTSCKIDTSYYPFDIQICPIKLHWYEYQIASRQFKTDHLKFYASNGLWTLVRFDLFSNDNNLPSYEMVYTFQRKPNYTLLNILFPVLLIALLGPLVFLLPVEAGERVSYSITVLLTVSVYMTIISDNLPRSSKPMAFLIYELFSLYVFCALIVVVVIINTKLYHFSSETPVPKPMILIAKIIRSNKNCLRKCSPCAAKRLMSNRRHRQDKYSGKQSADTELCHLKCQYQDESCEDRRIEEKHSEEIESGDIEEITWSDVAKALDKVALFIFYFFKIIFIVVCVCFAFRNKDK